MKKRLAKSLYTPEWEALCAILKRLRKAKGLTQTELSESLEQPQSFVAKVEAGQRKLDLRQFVIYTRTIKADPIRVMRQFLKAFNETSEADLRPPKRLR